MGCSFKLCYITDRHNLPADSLSSKLRDATDAGIDLVQIREKDLGTRSLMELAAEAVSFSRASRTKIVVNDRLDVAWAAGADGVHLGRRSLPMDRVRAIVPGNFIIGVSCHSAREVLEAASAGADYVLLGPVFETPSKLAYGPPLGLSVLKEAAAKVKTPVYALGGITPDRVMMCIEAGAAGIAGIRMFQEAASLRALVTALCAQPGTTREG
jgi:thiamine-phosphate pyrophosphorylase